MIMEKKSPKGIVHVNFFWYNRTNDHVQKDIKNFAGKSKTGRNLKGGFLHEYQ